MSWIRNTACSTLEKIEFNSLQCCGAGAESRGAEIKLPPEARAEITNCGSGSILFTTDLKKFFMEHNHGCGRSFWKLHNFKAITILIRKSNFHISYKTIWSRAGPGATIPWSRSRSRKNYYRLHNTACLTCLFFVGRRPKFILGSAFYLCILNPDQLKARFRILKVSYLWWFEVVRLRQVSPLRSSSFLKV